MTPYVYDGDLELIRDLIKVMYFPCSETNVMVGKEGHVLRIATKPLSHIDPSVYFRPDLDLNSLRRWVYPIVGEVQVSWPGNNILAELNGWQIKIRVPSNANLVCMNLVIAVMEAQQDTVGVE